MIAILPYIIVGSSHEGKIEWQNTTFAWQIIIQPLTYILLPSVRPSTWSHSCKTIHSFIPSSVTSDKETLKNNDIYPIGFFLHSRQYSRNTLFLCICGFHPSVFVLVFSIIVIIITIQVFLHKLINFPQFLITLCDVISCYYIVQ